VSGVVILDFRTPRPPKCRRMKCADRRRKRDLLTWAQGGICAHCEEPLPQTWERLTWDEPTLDHVHPRSAGGGNEIANLLVKHRACNEAGGSRPPSRRDRKWQAIVQARLAERFAQPERVHAHG